MQQCNAIIQYKNGMLILTKQKHLMLIKQKLDSTEDKLANALQQIDALRIFWYIKIS